MMQRRMRKIGSWFRGADPVLRGRPARPVVLGLALLVVGMILIPLGEAGAAVRAFERRFFQNFHGDFVIIGNVSMTCTPNAACTTTQTSPTSTTVNSEVVMRSVDVDPPAPGTNSSKATLRMPSDATPVFAMLFWGAEADGA